ncbi:MAG: HAD family hydrolase [Dehalococcoidia bacterium]|nr:HAD family hydrolase [Dehalococcoidia bacterium]
MQVTQMATSCSPQKRLGNNAMQELPKAILMDMDNTILAFDIAVMQTWGKVCRDFVSRVNGVTLSELLETVIERRDWFWSDPARNRWGRIHSVEAHRDIVRSALARLGIDSSDIANDMTDSLSVELDRIISPFPDALETIVQAKNREIRLALLTNGGTEAQRRKINKFNLTDYFDCIVVEGEFGVGKPDERVFRHALEQLQVAPADAWMVGDNLETDVAPAQKLGMTGIWVDWADKGLPKGNNVIPHRIIRGLPELL